MSGARHHSMPDDVDREMIRLLQADPDLSHRQVAKTVGLSQPTVSARIARLRELGFLRLQMGMDVAAVGLALAKIDVSTPEPLALLDGFRNCPLLVNALFTAGRTNVTLFFVGESHEHLQAIVDVHLRALPGVQVVDFQIVTQSFRPLVLPVSPTANRCDRTVCGYVCSSCRFYREDLCTGCPATVHYKGRFWRS